MWFGIITRQWDVIEDDVGAGTRHEGGAEHQGCLHCFEEVGRIKGYAILRMSVQVRREAVGNDGQA